MHQGKELRELAEKQRHIGKFAKEIGVSRDTLYKLFKKQTIPPKYVQVLQTLGIPITTPDITKSYSSTHPLKRGIASTNGFSKNLPYSQNIERSSPYTEGHKTPPMSKMIALTLAELLQLQIEGVHDVEMTKAISQVIQLKQRIEYLEKENVKLENDNEFLKELIKKK